jgi:MarR family transcriptional regulator, organic hydroperoxide resistance regulator
MSITQIDPRAFSCNASPDRRIFDIMTGTKSRTRRDRIPRNNEEAPEHATLTEERFPPLTISLRSFVKDGSDREFRQLIYALTRLQNQMARHVKLFAAYIGVTEAQYLMMRIIAETPDATVGYLAQRVYVTSQFVTIEIGGLIKKNIVEKRPNSADRRSMFLGLTRKGKRLLGELAAIMRKGNDIHFRSLTEERVRLLQEMINTLVTDGMSSLREVYAPLLDGRRAPSAQTDAKHRDGASRKIARMSTHNG